MSSSSSDSEEEPVSGDLLDRLKNYGDSLLDDEEYQHQKRKILKKKGLLKKSKKLSEDKKFTKTTESLKSNSKKKRKKRKVEEDVSKGSDDFSDEEWDDLGELDQKVGNKNKHLEKLKEALGLTPQEIERLKEEKKSAANKATKKEEVRIINGKKRPPVEVVVFEDPAKKKKKDKGKEKVPVEKKKPFKRELLKRPRPDEDDDSLEFDLKMARHEVQRFGITGFDNVKKEEAQIALAIKLGAEPPKKPCINYKTLMEQRKQQKMETTSKNEIERKLGGSSKKPGNKKRKDELSGVDGQIGMYRNGVQFLKGDDIKKITGAKTARQKSGK